MTWGHFYICVLFVLLLVTMVVEASVVDELSDSHHPESFVFRIPSIDGQPFCGNLTFNLEDATLESWIPQSIPSRDETSAV